MTVRTLLHAVVKNKIVAGIVVHLFHSLFGHCLYGVNAHIQLVPNEQHQRVDINNDHKHDDGTYGAVQRVVFAEVVHEDGKAQRGKNAQERGQDGPRRCQLPSFLYSRRIFINESDGVKYKAHDEDPRLLDL